MPTSFHFFKLIRFPKQDSFETVEQLSLLADVEHNQEVASTKVTLTKEKFVDAAARLLVTHDFLVHLTYPGRARKIRFREYVTQYDFPIYRLGAGKKGFATIAVCTKAKVAEDCVKRLNDQVDGFATEPLMIDFNKLRPLVKNVKGAWFREMQGANISSTGVFGSHVDKSKEFQHAEGIGKLNALMIVYPYDDATYTVMVTGRGGVILFDAFQAEEPALELVLDIREKLLDRAWADPKPEKKAKPRAARRR
jgi:hypothetical protein